MSMHKKCGAIKARHEELAALMSQGDLSGEDYTRLSMEYAELSPVVEVIDEYTKALQEKRIKSQTELYLT